MSSLQCGFWLHFITDNEYEINGYHARLAPIRLTVHLTEADECPNDDPVCSRILRLLSNLCYIQDLAYAPESTRTTHNIYAMLNLTYIFFLDYKKVDTVVLRMYFRSFRSKHTNMTLILQLHTSHLPFSARRIQSTTLALPGRNNIFLFFRFGTIMAWASNFRLQHQNLGKSC